MILNVMTLLWYLMMRSLMMMIGCSSWLFLPLYRGADPSWFWGGTKWTPQNNEHAATAMVLKQSKVFHWHIAARCSKHWRWCITTITTTNTMILMNVVGRGSSKAYDLPPICHYHGVRQSICWDVSVYIHGRTIHHIHSSSSTTKPCHVLSLRPLTLIMNSMSDCRPSGWDYTTGQIRKHRREACRA